MKRIFSISLALLMLASSVGFSMNNHICGGQVVKSSLTLGLQNLDCGMANMDQACEKEPSNKDQFKPKPCCKNQHQILQLDDNASMQSTAVNINSAFLFAFVHAFVYPILYTDKKVVQYTDYFPPLPDKDIQVLFQSFLI